MKKLTKMKLNLTPIIRFSIPVLLIFFAFACKKLTHDEPEIKPESIVDFFKPSAGTNPEVIRIAENWQKQKGFQGQLKEFIKKNGMPIWEKSFISVEKDRIALKVKNKTEAANDSSTTGIVFIPLKAENSNEITSYVFVGKHGDSTYTYRLYNKNDI